MVCDECGVNLDEEKVYTDMVHRIIFCPVCHNKKIIGFLKEYELSKKGTDKNEL